MDFIEQPTRDSYEIFEQLRANLHSLQFNSMSRDDKVKVFQETADEVAKEFMRPYLETCCPLGYKYRSPEVEIGNINRGPVSGTASPDRILIDEKLGARSPDSAFTTLFHEAVHHGQRILGKTVMIKPNDEINLMRATHRDLAPERDNFGIVTDGRVYVASNSRELSGHGDGELRDALYRSEFTERQAYQMTIDVSQHCGIKTGSTMWHMDSALDTLRERYSCQHMSDEQIYAMVDAAQLNIAKNRVPSNPREASMTYDMAAFIYEQRRSPDQRIQSMRDSFFSQMIAPERKAEMLARDGFVNAHTIPIEHVDEFTLQMIQELPQVVRDQNPMLMTVGVYKFGEEIAPLINKNTYDQWYFSEDNRFPNDILERVSGVMGHEYESVIRTTQDQTEQLIGDIDEVEIDLDGLTQDEDIDMNRLLSDEEFSEIDDLRAIGDEGEFYMTDMADSPEVDFEAPSLELGF